MNITWTIQNLTRDLSNGFVVNVAWACTAEQDGKSAFHGGTTAYENNPDASNFVPYENLTEATVLGWVWEAVDKAEIEATLTAKVEKQLKPTTANGMPW
jgi:hypothetical protein